MLSTNASNENFHAVLSVSFLPTVTDYKFRFAVRKCGHIYVYIHSISFLCCLTNFHLVLRGFQNVHRGDIDILLKLETGRTAALLPRADHSLLTRRILQQLRIHLVGGQLHISHHGAAYEAILHAQHVRVFVGICDTDVCQLYVEILIHRVQCPADTTKRSVLVRAVIAIAPIGAAAAA